jgi:hypothetical protein
MATAQPDAKLARPCYRRKHQVNDHDSITGTYTPIAFLLEDVVIAVVLSGIRLIHDVEYTGSRQVGAVLSVLGMGGIVLGILVWQEGGEAVGLLLALGALSLGLLAW